MSILDPMSEQSATPAATAAPTVLRIPTTRAVAAQIRAHEQAIEIARAKYAAYLTGVFEQADLAGRAQLVDVDDGGVFPLLVLHVAARHDGPG